MPYIQHLSINHFRNIEQSSLHPSPSFNVVIGPNGSGKTSLLEAIYYLGHNRSFRTHQQQHLVMFHASSFCLYTQVIHNQEPISLGIERLDSGQKKWRINKKSTQTASDLAQHLPIQLIDAYSHQYFLNGPKARRDFMNWGMFHMKHDFIKPWKSFNHALEQRNASLKQRYSARDTVFWNETFIQQAEIIDKSRQDYIKKLEPILNQCLQELLGITPIKLHYQRGWDPNQSLSEVLLATEYVEMKCGHTLHGPQRADLQLLYDDKPIREIFSHGQLKLAAYAMKIAQSELLLKETENTPIFLIDDLPSELDDNNQIKIITRLQEMNTQVFISAIDDHIKKNTLIDCLDDNTSYLKVDNGNIKEYTTATVFNETI